MNRINVVLLLTLLVPVGLIGTLLQSDRERPNSASSPNLLTCDAGRRAVIEAIAVDDRQKTRRQINNIVDRTSRLVMLVLRLPSTGLTA